MTKLRRLGKFLLDLFEIYIPAVTFVIMFLAFILQIVTRYFFNNPLSWPYEVSVIAFVWTVVLGACYARRRKEMVEFAVVFDMFPKKVRYMLNIFGNVIVAVGLAAALYPVYDYIQFLKIEKSTILRVPFNIAFFPFFIMMLLMIGHSLRDIADSLCQLRKGEQI
ncbi:TRAP transporter small permease [Paenibacillus alkalitolerans]|uniref:TRAP transporter small permease n=1 Tax=Paenibacillus alkalitolerans TaxID=2799335 RepID=UPI0018F76AAC|nr:TRAP transporter small permease [Paenibacillus alkalitolerans]